MATSLRYFEDIEPGETATGGPATLTREDIFAFARLYDPQPFHLDEAVARISPLEGLAASGWQTTALGMRLFYEAYVKHVASMGAPGVDEARWLRPVRPDDPLTLCVRIVDKRLSKSRPDRGFVGVALDLRNGADDCVMTQRFSMMVQRRGAAQVPRGLPPVITQPTSTTQSGDALPKPSDKRLSAVFDEVEVGAEMSLGRATFTAAKIVAFATMYDPQPFHLDPEAAAASHFGGLCASGWQTAALWMRAYIDARALSRAARLAEGLPAAVAGPSPGFTTMKWIRPVYAGETIHYALTVVDKRPIARAGWGLIQSKNHGYAADGALVFSFEGRMLWPFAPS